MKKLWEWGVYIAIVCASLSFSVFVYHPGWIPIFGTFICLGIGLYEYNQLKKED